MKLLIIVSSKDEGGVLQAQTQYMDALQRTNVEVHSLIIGEDTNKKLYQNVSNFDLGIKPYDLKVTGRPLNKFIKLIDILRWSKKVESNLPGVVLDNNFSAIIYGNISLSFLAYFIGKRSKSNTYFLMHNQINTYFSKIGYTIILKSLGITPIANSRYTQKKLGRICKNFVYPGYNKNRISYSYYGSTYRDDFGIDRDAIIIGIAARICHFKCQDIIVKILMSEKFKNENFVLLLAGVVQDSNTMNRIKELAGDDYGKKVLYLGNISKISKFYSSIDVLLNSGRGPESFGISVVEALASGVPVIAPNKGGTAETVIDEYNGWTFEGYNEISYSLVLSRLFENKSKLEEFGVNAKNSAKKFDLDYNIDKLLKILSK